ncbi:MAG: hypothetical protein H6706_09595 [Myxococcales bacterium]|nr:hypothetical protein [Myxococcales bacterium]
MPLTGCGEEVCDAADNDCDGQVDEVGCQCDPAAPDACYGGPPGTRGVGVCRDGTRGCDDTGEFFGLCEGWGGPGFEVCNGEDDDCDATADEDCQDCAGADEQCGDGLDNDCDGIADEGCTVCGDQERCGDGLDDDCDGRVDEGCGCQGEEICGNQIDDDCDLVVDESCLECELDDSCAECDPAETCNDGIDNDCNGLIDDGCDDPCQLREVCGNEVDEDCDGQVDEGCGCAPDAAEICADRADNDCDGQIDEQPCTMPDGRPEACNPNLRRACYGGNPAQIGVGPCAAGVQTCGPDGRWAACEGATLPGEEICDNGLDDDCDGHADNCRIAVEVNLNGDCITTRCPPEAAFPVGCDIAMAGGDHRGCVASQPDESVVYFQEGDVFGAGRVQGTLFCANVPGAGLTEETCRINKPTRYYPADRSGCPRTN